MGYADSDSDEVNCGSKLGERSQKLNNDTIAKISSHHEFLATVT
jgi:hypothetical protein